MIAIVLALTPVSAATGVAQSAVNGERMAHRVDTQNRPWVGNGQPTRLTGAVEDVVGPRLFTLGASDLADTVLVYVPPPDVAVVRHGDKVIVSGVVRPAAAEVLAREWHRFADGSEFKKHLANEAILVANSGASDGSDIVPNELLNTTDAEPGRGDETDQPLTDLRELAASTDERLVGRTVHIRHARITAIVSGGGFWVSSTDEQLFVLPGDEVHLQREQQVNIRGVVLELPAGAKNRLDDYAASRDEVLYVYATQVRVL